jgi:hypothetical protein
MVVMPTAVGARALAAALIVLEAALRVLEAAVRSSYVRTATGRGSRNERRSLAAKEAAAKTTIMVVRGFIP